MICLATRSRGFEDLLRTGSQMHVSLVGSAALILPQGAYVSLYLVLEAKFPTCIPVPLARSLFCSQVSIFAIIMHPLTWVS